MRICFCGGSMSRTLALVALLAGCAEGADPDFPNGYPGGSIDEGKADGATVTQIPYRGGIVLHDPTEVHVYWGDYWATAYGQAERDVLDGFADHAGHSSWYTHLAQYPDNNGAPGLVAPGTPVVIDDADLEPAATVSDRAIRTFLQARFADGRTSYDAETVYVVFTPPSVIVTTPWGKSCTDICGYHYNFPGTTTGTAKHDILYAVIPHLDCGGCTPPGTHANGAVLDAVRRRRSATRSPSR